MPDSDQPTAPANLPRKRPELDLAALERVRTQCPKLFEPHKKLTEAERHIARTFYKGQYDRGLSMRMLSEATNRGKGFVVALLHEAGTHMRPTGGATRSRAASGQTASERPRARSSTSAPAPAHLVLGPYLRAVRTARGFSAAKAADAIGHGPEAVSRMERGNTALTASEVHAFARAYELGDEVMVASLARMLPTRTTPGLWEACSDTARGAGDRAAAVLHATTSMRVFTSTGIPLPFQCTQYTQARAGRTAAAPDLGPVPVPRVTVEEGTRAWTLLIGAAALTKGPPAVMAAQLAHLLDLADQPGVDIRVVTQTTIAADIPYLAEHTLTTGMRLWREAPYQYFAGLRRGRERAQRLNELLRTAEPARRSLRLLNQARQRAVLATQESRS